MKHLCQWFSLEGRCYAMKALAAFGAPCQFKLARYGKTPASTFTQQHFTQKHSLLPHHGNVNAVSRSHGRKRNPASDQRGSFLQNMARRNQTRCLFVAPVS